MRNTFVTYLCCAMAIGNIALAADGDWPMLRGNPRMTGYQSLPGAMKEAPRVLAKHFLGAGSGAPTFADLRGSGQDNETLIIARNRLYAYDAQGKLLWEAAAPGYVMKEVKWVDDLDGDGHKEVVILAGNMDVPRQAFLVFNGQTGELLDTIKFITGDFGRQLLLGSYLTDTKGKQIAIFTSMLQSSDGPARGLGTGGLWTFDGKHIHQKWKWEPKEDALKYHCVLTADLSGDGKSRFVIQSWCHVWVLDPATGEEISHTHWDPQGANGRHYGWNILEDVDNDGKLDYVNIGLTKHVDMLHNVNGKLELAWTHGWTDAVTTETRYLRPAFGPVIDVDGDGRKEIVTSLFDGQKDNRWHLMIWDAVTGEQKFEAMDLVPIGTVAVWGKSGPRALLVARSDSITFDPPNAYEVWRKTGEKFEKMWSSSTAAFVTHIGTSGERRNFDYTGVNNNEPTSADVDGDGKNEFFTVDKNAGGKMQAWGVDATGKLVEKPGQPPSPPPAKASPPNLPLLNGVTVPMMLAADIDGDGRNELLSYDNVNATVWRVEDGELKNLETIPTSEIPVVCDLLGDGRPFMLTAGRGADRNLWVQARGPDKKIFWKFIFPDSSACGQWSMRPHNFVVGHFTGGKHLDVFTYATKPAARTYVLDGRTGHIVWTKEEIPKIERHYHGWESRVAVFDYDGDGNEDVFFCDPDFYCVGSGKNGDLLAGPVNLPLLCKFWTAYAAPIVLQREGEKPVVYLANSYASRMSLNMDGTLLWAEYLQTERWPLTQGNGLRCEALLPPSEKPQKRGWRGGQVEADGSFHCFDAATGKLFWKMEWPTAISGITSGDVNGDGEPEFVLAGQDGTLSALRNAGDRGELLWQKKFDAPVGTPLLADVNGDHKSEIIVSVGDGYIYVLGE